MEGCGARGARAVHGGCGEFDRPVMIRQWSPIFACEREMRPYIVLMPHLYLGHRGSSQTITPCPFESVRINSSTQRDDLLQFLSMFWAGLTYLSTRFGHGLGRPRHRRRICVSTPCPPWLTCHPHPSFFYFSFPFLQHISELRTLPCPVVGQPCPVIGQSSPETRRR
jgi:hypothetical protein